MLAPEAFDSLVAGDSANLNLTKTLITVDPPSRDCLQKLDRWRIFLVESSTIELDETVAVVVTFELST